jgi:peptidoglycan hydrolase-like protein with peptidoglycan-binding domain
MLPTLTIGIMGRDVFLLQEKLNASPPTALPLIDVDGFFGPVTLDRVKEFQRNNRLIDDGEVGPITWGVLLGGDQIEKPTFYAQDRC